MTPYFIVAETSLNINANPSNGYHKFAFITTDELALQQFKQMLVQSTFSHDEKCSALIDAVNRLNKLGPKPEEFKNVGNVPHILDIEQQLPYSILSSCEPCNNNVFWRIGGFGVKLYKCIPINISDYLTPVNDGLSLYLCKFDDTDYVILNLRDIVGRIPGLLELFNGDMDYLFNSIHQTTYWQHCSINRLANSFQNTAHTIKPPEYKYYTPDERYYRLGRSLSSEIIKEACRLLGMNSLSTEQYLSKKLQFIPYINSLR